MVNVQPKNAKLVDRARRIVAQATGRGLRAGRRSCWLAAGNSVRTAIVMEKKGVGRDEARRTAGRGGRPHLAGY